MRDYKLTLNLVTNEAPSSKIFKQYDTGNEIELELYQNEHLNADEKLVLTNESVLAFFKRQDGQVLQKNCSIRNGNAIIKTSKDVLGVPGILELECMVKKGDVETTTTRMTFTVKESIARDGAIEEDPRYTSDLVTELLDVRDNVKAETIGKIEEVATSLEEKVNKEQGKGLSTNDYTNAEKTKVSTIVNKAEISYVNSQIENVQRPVINYNGTLAQLQVDSTVDKTKNYLILSSTDTINYGKACYWNGDTWVAGWTVQGISIADKSVTSPKKTPLGQFPLYIGNVIPDLNTSTPSLTFPQGDKGFVWDNIPYDFNGASITIPLDPTSVGSSYCKIVFNTETKEIKTYTWGTWIPSDIREKCLIIATWDYTNKMLHSCFTYTINGRKIATVITDDEFNTKVNTSLPSSDNYKYLVRNTNNGYLITPNQQKTFDYEEFGSDLRVYIHCDQFVVREGGFISPTWEGIKNMINDTTRFVTTPNGKTDYLYLEDGESFCFDTTTNTFKIIPYGSCTNAKYIIVAYNWAGQIIRGTILQSFSLESRKKIKILEDKVSNLEKVNITELPPYWQTHLLAKNKEILDELNPLGSDGVAFGFITDIHIEVNEKHSGNILKNIDDNVSLSKILCGGDSHTSSATEEELNTKCREINKLFLPVRNKVITTLGNHDLFWKNGATLDTKKVYSEFFRAYEQNIITNNKEGLYGYSDDKSNKIRYFTLNCIDEGSYNFSPKQLQFVAENMKINDRGWSIVLTTHVPNANSNIIGSDAQPTNWAELIKILNACKNGSTYTGLGFSIDYTEKSSDVVGLFCGHVHYDNIYIDNTIPVVTTVNDMLQQWSTAPSRTKGTTTEHAIDIAIINKAAKTVKLKRIGAGADRTFNY
ncbi:MAG: metallophosphoesterase [Clostridium sp.]|uniref:metallophosphoesterase family protein n=1 Tax=Clostridium sp. TaxID=1506 RepID=UPI002915BEDE|nr:metallophosphoesterase [Clostridium sp.]MDU4939624.1 metallophosphoesterase [Clostridium sp.]